jgi:hypothetical protein|tara:strand:- start:1446 stop:2057 length:612 start_codon:yes stop_codon:yes gene_type:complete
LLDSGLTIEGQCKILTVIRQKLECSMIYMVEMNLIDRDKRKEWDNWYDEHTKMLLTFPGFHATQRFECIDNAKAPFVALHHVDGPEFFNSFAYKNNAGPAGTGEWRNKMDNWSRNLFEGIETTPNISLEEHLIVIEQGCKLPVIENFEIVWLESVGLDKDVERRGFASSKSKPIIEQIRQLSNVRVLKPLNKRRTETDLRFSH